MAGSCTRCMIRQTSPRGMLTQLGSNAVRACQTSWLTRLSAFLGDILSVLVKRPASQCFSPLRICTIVVHMHPGLVTFLIKHELTLCGPQVYTQLARHALCVQCSLTPSLHHWLSRDPSHVHPLWINRSHRQATVLPFSPHLT